MRKVFLKALSGGEILAKDIYAQNYSSILMPKGTVLKKDYIEKLVRLGIDTAFIEDEKKTETYNTNTMPGLMESCQNQIKEALERHIYKHNEELKKLCRVAEDMIMEAVSEEPLSERMIEIQEEKGDIYTHSLQVCTLSVILALKFRLDKEVVQDILKGGLLHDIGLRYITVPYENIPIEKLPESEKKDYKLHTLEGYRALEQESWISSCTKEIILYHHELLDGSGYPIRLKGNKMSLPVKIVSVCDAFDERLAGIGYERCRLQEALEYLRDSSGTLFEKQVTDAFLKIIVQYPTGCLVELNTGEIGKVISQNKEMPERPVIQLIKSKSGVYYSKKEKIDLLKVLNIFITQILDEEDC